MRLTPILFAIPAIFLASCGTDLAIVSKDRASSGVNFTGAPDYTSADPSEKVIAAGKSMPKDKHGMPLYKDNERVRYVRTTAYTCTESDHIEYGSKNACGTPLRYTSRVRSAAADWSVYPVGTVFKIKGMNQLFVVDDYGSALTGTGTIDLYTPTHSHMRTWGRRNVEISIVRWGSYQRSAEILADRTRHWHCKHMHTAICRKTGIHSNRTAHHHH